MILIVDDSEDVAKIVQRFLRFAGHEAVAVHSGVAALEFLQDRRPDLIILDVNMPEMDGIEVLQAIKRDATVSQIPVIMYSADPHDEKIIEAHELGAVGYMVKGRIDFNDLLARIQELLDLPTG